MTDIRTGYIMEKYPVVKRPDLEYNSIKLNWNVNLGCATTL